jgi:hypothetical protein
VFLIGQLWISTINYCLCIIDSEQDYIELSTSEDSESEEENEKKDKEDKNRIITFDFIFIKTLLYLNRYSFKRFISLHHPDISTPPPKNDSHLT